MTIGSWHFTPHWVATVVYLPLCALLISLGVWQWNRSVAKDAISADVGTLQTESEMRVEAGGTLEPRRHQKLIATGQLVNNRQFLVDNRTHKGRAGYHVITPLRLSPHSYVLLNRGWIPIGASREQLPDVSVDTMRRTIMGKAHYPAQDQLLLGASGYEQTEWPRVVQRLEIPVIEAILRGKVFSYSVRLDPSEPDGFGRTWPVYYGISAERHRGYSFQWFALALTLTTIYIVVNTRRRSQ